MEELRLGVAISLRIPVPGDAGELAAAVDESRGDLAPWMEWCTPTYAAVEAGQWIDGARSGHEDKCSFEFLIVDEGDRIVGCCGVNLVNNFHRYANLGYWVRTSATGRGVAVAAVIQVADWAFRHSELERLEIVVAVGNRRSCRVATKAGAHHEGILRRRLRVREDFHDAVMYSIVRDDRTGTNSGDEAAP